MNASRTFLSPRDTKYNKIPRARKGDLGNDLGRGPCFVTFDSSIYVINIINNGEVIQSFLLNMFTYNRVTMGQ